MGQRLELQARLEEICPNVYYQPPKNVAMQYPCIVYKLKGIDDTYASNDRYLTVNEYEAVVIDRDPDSQIPRAILTAFRYSRFSSHYTADNLHHFALTIKDIHREDVNHE